jgi:uncharacterized protein (DUF2384 family)
VHYSVEESPRDQQVAQVVGWIKAHGGQATARELMRSQVAGLKKRSDVDLLFAEMVDRELGTVENQGRRRSVVTLYQPNGGSGT